MNFGEELGFWYFRLNGFLPMVSFVLHRPDQPRRHNADSDLLAVRFQHVFEEVGGQPDDWDNHRFDEWGLGHADHIVCVIAEVKTGGHTGAAINRAFRPNRVLYALSRFGVLALPDCEEVCRRLSEESVVYHREVAFAKILISSLHKRTGNHDNVTPYRHLQLEDAVCFIRSRMYDYRVEKESARMFFPGDLIQYFAWEANLPGAIHHNQE